MAGSDEAPDLDKILESTLKEHARESYLNAERIENYDNILDNAKQAYRAVITVKGRVRHHLLRTDPKMREKAFRAYVKEVVKGGLEQNNAAAEERKRVLALVDRWKPGDTSPEFEPINFYFNGITRHNVHEYINDLHTMATKGKRQTILSNEHHAEMHAEQRKAHMAEWGRVSAAKLDKALTMYGIPQRIYKMTGEKGPKEGEEVHSSQDLFNMLQVYNQGPKGQEAYKKMVKDINKDLAGK